MYSTERIHLDMTIFVYREMKFKKILSFYFRPLPVEVILDKARRALNQEGYNLVYSNCEHFVTECRYGQSNSRQVNQP